MTKKRGRKAVVARKTKETDITVRLNVDGEGRTKIKTGIGILDHLLELFAFHGFFDLEIAACGDLNIDGHHTNEDIGIVLGEAFKKALGDKRGIKRFGFAFVPMEDVLANAVVDVSGRSWYRLTTDSRSTVAPAEHEEEGYTFKDAEHLMEAFVKHSGMNLNILINSSTMSPDLHTTLEPVFKALGLALDQATQIDPRRKGIPSTKGIID